MKTLTKELTLIKKFALIKKLAREHLKPLGRKAKLIDYGPYINSDRVFWVTFKYNGLIETQYVAMPGFWN